MSKAVEPTARKPASKANVPLRTKGKDAPVKAVQLKTPVASPKTPEVKQGHAVAQRKHRAKVDKMQSDLDEAHRNRDEAERRLSDFSMERARTEEKRSTQLANELDKARRKITDL